MESLEAILRATCFQLNPAGTPGGGELYFAKIHRRGCPSLYLGVTLGPNFDFEHDLDPLQKRMLVWWIRLWNRRN